MPKFCVFVTDGIFVTDGWRPAAPPMPEPWQMAFDLAPALTGPISTPPGCEKNFRIKRHCRTFDGAFFCGMEWDEWNLVRALVQPHNVVLELGARFGTTSCVLAERTGNNGNVVAVEPDPKAHKQLLRNRQRHVRHNTASNRVDLTISMASRTKFDCSVDTRLLR